LRKLSSKKYGLYKRIKNCVLNQLKEEEEEEEEEEEGISKKVCASIFKRIKEIAEKNQLNRGTSLQI